MPQDLTDDKSTLVQVMAWCRQATSHYLNQCWPRSQKPYGVTRLQWVNTLRPRQNGYQFPDDTFKCIFLNENIQILVKIALKFIPKYPINNIPTLVQIMDWCWPGDKPLCEPMMVSSHICSIQPFRNFISAGLAMDNFIPYFILDIITYPC